MYCNAKSIAINSRPVQEVKKYKMFPQPWTLVSMVVFITPIRTILSKN